MTEPKKRKTPTSSSLQGPLEALGGARRHLEAFGLQEALESPQKLGKALASSWPSEALCSGAMALFKSLKKSGNVGRQPEN